MVLGMLATDGEVKYRWGKQMLSLKQERDDCRGSFRFESNGVAYRPAPISFILKLVSPTQRIRPLSGITGGWGRGSVMRQKSSLTVNRPGVRSVRLSHEPFYKETRCFLSPFQERSMN